MRTLSLSIIAVLIFGGVAQAQSMNVRAITDDVLRDVCGPFSRDRDMWAALGAAERLGYSVMSHDPVNLRIGAADAQPPPRGLVLFRRHRGTVRLSMDYGRGLCGVGIEEGTVRTVVEAAGPHLRGLGLEPVFEAVDERPAVSVWRGSGLQVVIAASLHHRPGVELVLEIAPGGAD